MRRARVVIQRAVLVARFPPQRLPVPCLPAALLSFQLYLATCNHWQKPFAPAAIATADIRGFIGVACGAGPVIAQQVPCLLLPLAAKHVRKPADVMGGVPLILKYCSPWPVAFDSMFSGTSRVFKGRRHRKGVCQYSPVPQ